MDAKRKFGWKHAAAMVAGVALTIALIVLLAVAFLVWSGAMDRWAQRAIVNQIERVTGTRVELGKFHFGFRPLHVRFDGLTLHGREPEGTPPLFHADELQADIYVESVWGRKISLGSVTLTHFSVHIRVAADGSTNFPGPKTPSPTTGGSPVQRLFDIKIAHLRLNDGEILWNDTRVPLVAEGGNFEFGMDYGAEGGRPIYLAHTSWQKFQIVARRYLPFASDLSVNFTLRPNSLSITQALWKIPNSQFDAQVELADFSHPTWNFRYRGLLNLTDIRSILRKPTTPSGRVQFTGDGSYAEKQVNVSGRYTADRIAMNYQWFHPGEITSRGSYRANQKTLDIPDLQASALGGTLSGHLQMDIAAQRFRVQSQVRGLDMSRVLSAEDNPDLPVLPLHWTGKVDVDALTTWIADFQHVDSQGVSVWSAPDESAPAQIPVGGRINFHYAADRRDCEFTPSEISTPTSHIGFQGKLAATNSAMDFVFDTQDLTTWDDFINRLRGLDAEPQPISGRFHWQGALIGPLDGPTFSGHVKGSEARYASLYWDEIEGEVTYSPTELRLVRARAVRGRSSADIDLALAFEEWSFLPGSEWSFNANLVGANTDDLQKLLGTSYPARGTLNGQFHGKGTRANPDLSGLFDVSDAVAWTWHIERARGQLTLNHGEVRIANAEIRLPATAAGTAAGLLTGNFLYRLDERSVLFDIAGAGLSLASIERIQSPKVPVGGRLNLQLHGQGPLSSPQLHATLRLVNLTIGSEEVGSFDAIADSDGQHVNASIDSAMASGRLAAKLNMTLGGDYPLMGEITAEQLDIDPLTTSVLHLTGLTGHSMVDGHFAIAGSGARPETISVDANLSRVSLDYQYVKLENNGPVRIGYRGNEVRVQQASLRGTDTDFQVTGFARFAGDRSLGLRVDGAVSLQLLGGFVPRMESSGRAQINAAIAGTLSAPRINGKIHVQDAAVRYGEFPTGLSNVSGDFNFDATRLVFENVSAESGGGRLNIGGAVTYGDGDLNYAINASTDQVRVRYPVGMSWLLGGTLRFSGNARAATLSGRVVVDRLLMAEGFDLGSFMISSKEPVNGPSTTSSFMRNLSFDIEADSSPDSRMEWSGANLQTDASLRVRGTWEHPILLGHIHLLSGEMAFRGNRYTITRGDINFANPFRLDPALNVEATTTIRQYEVTLDFTGPASRLTLAYRSDPPLPSSDIIALLALGKTSEESAQRSATGQAGGLGASTLLSEAISSQLGGRIERLFGISHFRVGQPVTGPTSGQNAIASVTIEQQITPGLVITYTTNVTSTQREVIQVEYTVNHIYSVVALRDENGTFGIDVIRKTRFK